MNYVEHYDVHTHYVRNDHMELSLLLFLSLMFFHYTKMCPNSLWVSLDFE